MNGEKKTIRVVEPERQFHPSIFFFQLLSSHPFPFFFPFLLSLFSISRLTLAETRTIRLGNRNEPRVFIATYFATIVIYISFLFISMTSRAKEYMSKGARSRVKRARIEILTTASLSSNRHGTARRRVASFLHD